MSVYFAGWLLWNQLGTDINGEEVMRNLAADFLLMKSRIAIGANSDGKWSGFWADKAYTSGVEAVIG